MYVSYACTGRGRHFHRAVESFYHGCPKFNWLLLCTDVFHQFTWHYYLVQAWQEKGKMKWDFKHLSFGDKSHWNQAFKRKRLKVSENQMFMTSQANSEAPSFLFAIIFCPLFQARFVGRDIGATGSIRRNMETQKKFKCFFRTKIEVASFQDKQLRNKCFNFNLINNTTIRHYNALQFDGTGDSWKQEKSEPLMRNLSAT